MPEQLHRSYGALGAHALKVALLLAALDTAARPVVVTLPHFARALEIVESWRASLHHVWAASVLTEEARGSQRLLELLVAADGRGLTVRDLCQRLHLRSREVQALLSVLALAGQVDSTRFQAANNKVIEVWTATP